MTVPQHIEPQQRRELGELNAKLAADPQLVSTFLKLLADAGGDSERLRALTLDRLSIAKEALPVTSGALFKQLIKSLWNDHKIRQRDETDFFAAMIRVARLAAKAEELGLKLNGPYESWPERQVFPLCQFSEPEIDILSSIVKVRSSRSGTVDVLTEGRTVSLNYNALMKSICPLVNMNSIE